MGPVMALSEIFKNELEEGVAVIHLLSFLWEESDQVPDSCKTNLFHLLQWVYMLQAVWSLQVYPL